MTQTVAATEILHEELARATAKMKALSWACTTMCNPIFRGPEHCVARGVVGTVSVMGLRKGLFLRFHLTALALLDRAAQKVFDLAVCASQVVGGPPLKFFPEVGGQPEEEGFLFGQGAPSIEESLFSEEGPVEAPGPPTPP